MAVPAHARSGGGDDAGAVVLRAATTQELATLSFGTVVTGNSGGVVVVGSNGAQQCGAGLTCAGERSPARFAVSGSPGQQVGIVVPPVALLSGPAGATMTAVLEAGADRIDLTDGRGVVEVGGSIALSPDLAPGNYTGSFTIDLIYQ